MDFKIKQDPLKSPIFKINLVHGKYKTEEITPFCNYHGISMLNLYNKKYGKGDEFLTYTKLKEDFGIILNEKERRFLYDSFVMTRNSKGWFMIYDIENVMKYVQWKEERKRQEAQYKKEQ